MPNFDTSSWASLEGDFNVHIQSADAKAVADAADALANLLCFSPDEATSLRPRPIAEAVTAALRRHQRDKDVQFNGCTALHDLCGAHFPELPAELRRDPSVLRTVQAAAAVRRDLKRECHWYRELCEWLAPRAEDKGGQKSGYPAAQPGATSPHQTGYPSADASAPSAPSCDQGTKKKKFPTWSSEGGQKATAVPEFDGSSWEALEPDFNEHIQSADANTAREAAGALCRLLLRHPTEALRELRPRPVAQAVTAALRRHPTDGLVQWHGCWTLQLLCKRFPQLRTELQREPSVLATVRAAPGAVGLERCNWYRELCEWLQSQAEDKGGQKSGYTVAQPGATSPHQSIAAAVPKEVEGRNPAVQREDLDVRDTHWYYEYRQMVFKLLEDAEEDGATGMVLISIKPKIVNEMTLQEWPALQTDLHQAFREKNEPFFNRKKEEVVKFAKITTQQFSVQELGEELLTRTRNGKQAIICSVPEEHFEEVEEIRKDFNKSRPSTHGKVHKAWMTRNHMRRSPRKQTPKSGGSP